MRLPLRHTGYRYALNLAIIENTGSLRRLLVKAPANSRFRPLTTSQFRPATFAKVFVGRKQPIRGLWERGGRFYAQITVENAATGQKKSRRVPLKNKDAQPVATVSQAVSQMKRLQLNRADSTLPVLTRTPKFFDCAARYLDFISSGQGTKKPGTIQKERTTLAQWSEPIGDLRLDQIKRNRYHPPANAGWLLGSFEFTFNQPMKYHAGTCLRLNFPTEDTTFTMLCRLMAWSCGRLLAVLLFANGPLAMAQAEPPHPILTIPAVANRTTLANTILNSWNETNYVNSFVPKQAPREEGNFAGAVVAGDTSWSWNSFTPNQITSKPSNTVFPGAAGYMQYTQAVTVLDGSTVQIPYYLEAGSTTARSLVQAAIDYHKREKLRSDLNALADAYMTSGPTHATRNQDYARRIAVALYEWGKCVPQYFATGSNIGGTADVLIDMSPSFQATDNMQRCSAFNGFGDELADDELLAFDAIYDSPALAALSVEKGVDVRAFIATNLLGNMGDFFVYHVPPEVATIGNLPGASQVIALMARVLNRPDYITWLDDYFRIVAGDRLNREGVILESLGYSINYIRTVRKGVGYAGDYFLTRPADTIALTNAQNHLAGYSDQLLMGIANFQTISLPNGQLPSFGDTTDQGFFGANTEIKVSNKGNSGLMSAYGTVSLGAGSSPATAVQLNTMFAGDENHKRSDTAALVLYAFKNELLGNIRYFNGSLERQFGEQPVAHNLVTIDRGDMSNRSANTDGNGDLTLFEPGNNGLGVTEIDGQRICSNKATRYQRLLLLNTRELAKPYIVDVFRVSGGTTHDYTFHGAIEFDQNYECSFPLVTNSSLYPMLEPGETWTPPTSQYANFPFYGMWRNVSSNTAPGDFQITYRDPSSTNRDCKLWMTDDGTAKVYIGRTPVPAREHVIPHSFFDNGLWRPSAIIRKRVTSGTLQDLFVSVIEPLNNGTNGIVAVDRLPVSGSGLDSCALRITFNDGRTDTYLVNLRNPQVAGANTGTATVSTADGQYVLTGRIGAHSDGPLGPRVWTVDATDFQCAGRRLVTPDRHYSGLIAGETRQIYGAAYDAFTTTTPLPTGTALRGQQLQFNFGTLSSPATTGISEMFKIDKVILTNGLYSICFTNDHCLEITNGVTSKEQQLPFRKFTTSNSFDIILSASAAPISPLTNIALAVNTNSGAIPFNFGTLGVTAGTSLQVLATSSNPTLIPNVNLALGGSGTNRTITLTPLSNQSGVSFITVSTTDGVWTNSRSFTLTVSSGGPDTNPPAVNITVPTNNASFPLGSVINVAANITDDLAVAGGELYVDDVFQSTDAAVPFTWTVSGFAVGVHTLAVRGVDLFGNAATNNVNVFVTPPAFIACDAGDASVYENGTVDAGTATSLLGAGGSSPWVDRCTVYVFQLPDLGVLANPFNTASLTFNYEGKQNTLKNNDLYGLGRRASAAVLAGDYYGQTNAPDPTDATLLQTNILVDGSTIGLISNSLAGGTALRNYLNAQYASGAGIGQFVFLRLNSAGAKTAINRATLTMSEGAAVGPPDTRPRLNFFAIAANNPPTISTIANQTVNEGTPTAALPFTVSDDLTPLAALVINTASSNTNLVPNANVMLGGGGANRTVRVSPVGSQTGITTIQLVVSDGTFTATNSFLLTVSGGPDIDGDGLADGSEIFLGRDPNSASDLAFEFNTDGNFENWGTFAGITNSAVTNGSISGISTNGDPHFQRSGFNFDGNSVSNVLVHLRLTTNSNVQLFWGRVGSTSFAAAKSVTATYTLPNTWQTLVFLLSTNSEWQGQTITSLRIDPGAVANQTFEIDWVRAANGNLFAPALIAVTNRTIIAGQTLTITNTATDGDVPTQTLTFSVINPPAGATVTTNGVFAWRPTIAQSPSTNTIKVAVTDNGSPNLSTTNSFIVTVNQPPKPVVSAVNLSNGQFRFTINGTNGPDYIILTSTNLLNWSPLWTNVSPTLSFSQTNAVTNSGQRFYRVLLGP